MFGLDAGAVDEVLELLELLELPHAASTTAAALAAMIAEDEREGVDLSRKEGLRGGSM
jgi:hypothetical protein